MRFFTKSALMGRVMICILLAASQHAYSQKGVNIRGRVYDKDNQPVPAATILLGSSSTATAEDGTFTFSDVTNGDRALEATAIGYRNFRDTIRIGNQDQTLSIRMFKEDQFLDQVTV